MLTFHARFSRFFTELCSCCLASLSLHPRMCPLFVLRLHFHVTVTVLLSTPTLRLCGNGTDGGWKISLAVYFAQPRQLNVFFNSQNVSYENGASSPSPTFNSLPRQSQPQKSPWINGNGNGTATSGNLSELDSLLEDLSNARYNSGAEKKSEFRSMRAHPQNRSLTPFAHKYKFPLFVSL